MYCGRSTSRISKHCAAPRPLAFATLAIRCSNSAPARPYVGRQSEMEYKMLFLVTLTYIRPVEEVHAHLDTHRDWLGKYAANGQILVAGPLQSGDGGLLLAHCEDRTELDALLTKDSFHIHRLVKYDVQAMTPTVRAWDFPMTWAPDARVASRVD